VWSGLASLSATRLRVNAISGSSKLLKAS
jgi:hypothetical protein